MPSAESDLPRAVLAALQNSEIFGVLDEASLRRFAAAGGVVRLERGALLFAKGDEGDAAFIVLDGALEVRDVARDGKELVIAAADAGKLVGEMAVLDGAPRSADVVAARACTLWRLPRAAVLGAVLVSGEAAVRLLAELCRRLRASNAALELASRRSIEGRLAALLIAEQSRLGIVALTQTEIARRIGASREQVNRKLRGWCEAGWVSVEKQGVQVRQAGPLEDLARL
jgi:CRP-like cAMP-binding protein